MPISAVDAISPAFQHTKKQLIEPFRASQWAKLALVGFLAGEVHSGGCSGGNFQMPTRTSGGERFLELGLPAMNPVAYAALIALLVVAVLVLWVLFIYVNSVMRFVLFDSVVAKQCEIRQYWNRRQKPGLRYFAWQLLLFLAMMVGLTILVGIPATFALAVGWLKQSSQHMVPLILGGVLLFFLVTTFVVLWLIVLVFSKDFIVPQMALEDIGPMEAWRRLLPMLKSEKGGYAGYLGMKIVMSIGAAVIVGIAAMIIILLTLIPIGGVGAVLVLMGKSGGLHWNLYTITLAVVIGSFLLAFILYVVSLVSVPAIVFFPAYSIYFFAARYRALDAVLRPAPPPFLSPEPSSY
ncbi:MAG: hypothetical protein DMG86_17870 [Acidobacteria bacterium]|nr:MAG: hypothetical protein AUI17_07495 [Acidobacteriales bacterium 13_2_20CM_2_55_5]OLD19854.1 MAG: hypothetical protein AUI85_02010 [Acidobacteriales bacterium 13_1_40CM_3_55_5]PYV97744.1 MAG: hypothetical protein DMG86_17870 [Acidobacteriota bacterium]PYX16621.1 MAG: hypothetical protein DMG84_06925 [Acidobacteriota bacterium]